MVSYTLEILPYSIRAKGFALMVRYDPGVLAPSLTCLSPKNLVVSFGLAFSQYVDAWALATIGWKYVSLSPLDGKSLDSSLTVPRVLCMVGLRIGFRYRIHCGDARTDAGRNRSALRR